jgi:hypothetical protein
LPLCNADEHDEASIENDGKADPEVYDNWADPQGRVHEHWADIDRLNVRNGGNLVSADEGLRSQWGSKPPEKFRGHISLESSLDRSSSFQCAF